MRVANTRANRFRARHGRHGGMAIMEMAIVMPVLIYLAMGMVEYGEFFYLKNTFQQAARDACRAGIMPNAMQADPATAASRTLATAGVTFQSSWLTVTDITPAGFGAVYGTGSVSDCSTVAVGHALTFAVTTTYGAMPGAVRPLSNISAIGGIPSSRAIAGTSTALKE
jgi:Flp pilus assembly protein TadG